MDSANLISKALDNLNRENPTILRDTMQNGQFFNNGEEGIDCEADPTIPWSYGQTVLDVFKKV